VVSLTTALTTPSTPPEIIQALLNLAEFMERNEKSLPIDIRTLGQYARRCHAYAKALHYKEIEFQANPSSSTIESLIGIYNQLQMRDAAVGILSYAQHKHRVELKETWYETLQRWDEALAAYERKQKEEPHSFDIALGRMRCLNALGEWSSLSNLVQETWSEAFDQQKKAMAPLAAAAAWGLGNWDRMKDYVQVLSSESPDGMFFRSILSIHDGSYEDAMNFIVCTRNTLDTEVTALVGESYNRVYKLLDMTNTLVFFPNINI
jgi:FKBP12-rapamycin complex-associated protein